MRSDSGPRHVSVPIDRHLVDHPDERGLSHEWRLGHRKPRLHLDRRYRCPSLGAFYERYLGGVRDTFDWGPDSAVFVGWPTYALSSARRQGQPGPSPEATTIEVWWRASNAQVLYERAVADGVPILVEPFDGPFG
ncbi:MAG TPA: hypothetical protein VIV06_03120, partial [Candidatus Limnocylindrales bacterium]